MNRHEALIVDGEINWEATKNPIYANLGIDDLRVTRVEWSDERFVKDYVEDLRLGKKPDLSETLLSAKGLLNWYVTGITPKSPCDIILGVLYGMTTDGYNESVLNEYLWNAPNQKTLENPGEVSFLPEFQYANKINQTVTIAGYQRQKAVTQNGVTKWYTQLWDRLSNTDGDKELFEAKMALNFMGFLAMNLLRLSTKESDSVSTHISKSVKDSFRSLWKQALPCDSVFPPHYKMSEKFTFLFRRFRPNANRCMAALVYSYGAATPANAKTIRGILNKGCLLSLGMTGLGILDWTQRAAKLQRISPTEMMRYMAVGNHIATNMAMLKLIADYADPEAKQYSWPWARMFANGAFFDLAVINDPFYAAVMVAICTGLNANDPLWGIASMNVEKVKSQKVRAINLATNIVTHIQKKIADTAETSCRRRHR